MAQTTEKEVQHTDADGEEMRPIRFVRRELTRPDGITVKVDVPVYPPFELKPTRKARAPRKPPSPRARSRHKNQKTG